MQLNLSAAEIQQQKALYKDRVFESQGGGSFGLNQRRSAYSNVPNDFSLKVQICITDLNIKASEVVSMIDNFYLNSANWGFSPLVGIEYQLVQGHCHYYTSREN